MADPRVFYLQTGNELIVVVIVVDDMKFATNSGTLLDRLRSNLKATFDVKLLGSLRPFIG